MKNWVCWMGLFSAIGCGGSDEEFTSNDQPDLELSDAPAALSEAVCDALFRCIPLQGAFLGSVEQCAEIFRAEFTAASFNMIEDAVEEERVVYDQEAAQGCLDALDSADCSAIDLRYIDECNDVFTGTVERGDDCTLDEECSGESFCLFEGSCPGACSGLLSAGEGCVEDEHCEPGLVCSEATARCVAPSDEGQSCGMGQPQCAQPFLCLGEDEDAGEPGVCVAAEQAFSRTEGEDCVFIGDDPALCQEGLACRIEDINATDGIVAVCREMVQAGDECGLALPSMCESGHYCEGIDLEAGELSGTCAPLPESGDDCADALFTPCQIGLICLDGTCTERKNNGQSCEIDTECQSDNCVDGGCAPLSPCD